MCCCTQAKSYDTFSSGHVLVNEDKPIDMTHYLRADLNVELSSALPGELLPTSEL